MFTDVFTYICDFLDTTDILKLFMCSTTLRNKCQKNTGNPYHTFWVYPRWFVYLCRDTRLELRRLCDVDCTIGLQTVCPAITNLKLSRQYNRAINMRTCHTLRSLEIGEFFERPLTLNDIPKELTTLSFANGPSVLSFFNQPILPGVLPATLKQLFLGHSFVHPLDEKVLPSSLRELHLGYKYDLPLCQIYFPPGLATLALGDKFQHEIKYGDLPDSLLTLIIGQHYNHRLILPSKLKTLRFKPDGSFNVPLPHLPPTLTELDLGDAYTHQIPGSTALRKLSFGEHGEFNRRLQLPSTLTELNLSLMFNQPLEESLKYTRLHRLVLGNKFNHSILPGTLPMSLRELHFGRNFDTPLIPGSFPSFLEKLHFNSLARFDHPIGLGVLPESLIELRFGQRSSFNSTILWLPNSLKVIQFGLNFHRDIPNIPLSTQFIYLSFRSHLKRTLLIDNLPEHMLRNIDSMVNRRIRIRNPIKSYNPIRIH